MMHNLHVKICGITSLEDARLAVDAGADFLGFIFVPQSPRYVRIETAAAIAPEVAGRILTVGVFQDAPASAIEDTVERCGLDLVQLHGCETPALARQIGVDRVWKAVSLGTDADVALALNYPAAGIVADTMVGTRRGGTGRVGNWDLARQLAGQRRTILAGGLCPANIAEAVRHVHPFAVDVSSGVEIEPGRKDPEKVMQFVIAARAAGAAFLTEPAERRGEST